MATTRSFSSMLQEYITGDICKEELIMRDYVVQKVKKKNDWKGSTIPVPHKKGGASSVSFGSLTAENDVSEDDLVRGELNSYVEMWGTMKFNHTDIIQHDGEVNEDSFLDILPDQLEEFMDYVKEVTSVQLGSGPHFAKATADGGADGTVVVDHPERFDIGMKVTLDDDDTAAASYYVTAIAVETDDITLSATRGGSAADISAYTSGQNAKFYHPGVFDSGGNHDTFLSMRDVFLSATNGGAASVYGNTKLSAPILQAWNESGSSVTAANILEKLFDFMANARKRGKGRFTELLMDLTNYGSILKLIEVQKGGYRVVEDETASQYGWFETTIASVTGQRIKIVGIQEWESDVISAVDWRSFDFCTNGFFRKRKSPDGREFYETRGTGGYSYLVDLCLFGQMRYCQIGHNAILHSISY